MVDAEHYISPSRNQCRIDDESLDLTINHTIDGGVLNHQVRRCKSCSANRTAASAAAALSRC
jgi:hypothetical protein